MALLLAAALIAVPLTAAPTARAQDNGLAQKPPQGWSSWSFLRRNPTASAFEAQAAAMKNSGLSELGYSYVNLDDFWYQCPGGQGPNVDAYGRWVTDTSRFPASGSTDGIQAVADYVHSLGLKFGLYVTPGISHQAVARNTQILGTSYHAADIATSANERNYNCGGMVGIDYAKPGAQPFVNSWANQFAGWGVDYVKIDGVGADDIGDVQAWSQALRQTGRPIHLELSNQLAQSQAATWAQYANGWRTGDDVECYCGANSSSFPLTDWNHIKLRFDQAASWQPYGRPGGWNDYDSIEVGNGSNDGLTAPERQTQLSLWSLAASPLLLGTDLTALDPTDMGYLKNSSVLAVDQDGVDAVRISATATSQVFAKREASGAFVIGLFNTDTSAAHNVSADLLQLGLYGSVGLTDLWTGASLGSPSGSYTAASVPPGGVALIRAVPTAGTGGTAALTGAASGKCLDVYDNQTAPGTKVELWGCNGGANQQWTPTSAGELRANGATECLDVVGRATTDGTAVDLWPCHGGANQKWSVRSDGTVRATQSDLCLDTAGSGTSDGTAIAVRTCNGQSSQHWSGPPVSTTAVYEAESAANTDTGGAGPADCADCSGGRKVGFVGSGGTLAFNGVQAVTTGSHQIVVAYCDGDTTTGRQAYVSVNGAAPQLVSFRPTPGWTTPGYATVSVQLSAGTNQITFSNPTAYAPDIDRIDVVG
ncbi:ricin-type beta-trefoil lectin domain protein [Streptomyces sp. NPDC051976]|uniref:ricin-type beta-trefoil lectin domain protein n=1 Tax=Streptomyces sp. NPDC051976 TaxID=3154947 RepID=UPI00344AAA7A